MAALIGMFDDIAACGHLPIPASWQGGRVEAAELRAMVEEAMKRSAIAWLTYPGSDRPRGAWYVWHEGAAYVVSGGVEQLLPGIEQATRVEVTVRSKETGARLVSWVAAATVQPPGTDGWRAAADLLKAERLNPPPGVDLLAAWAQESTISRLTPTGEFREYPGAYPDGSLAAAPPDSPAATIGKLPWVAHRRPRRAPKL